MDDHPDALAFTAFAGDRRIAAGDRRQVALAVKAAVDAGASHVLAFEDASGRQLDFDLSGSAADVAARVAPAPAGRGRPKLGVVPREVTLLPRHWEWLAQQPGGASAALRRLVDQARKANAGADEARQARDAAYRLMSALAGDRPGFEDASRALFAADFDRALDQVATWPADIADYLSGRLQIARHMHAAVAAEAG
ncbi:MAG: DUF2239 family protein [Phenylobacterium sp.]|uniref:DUF2239 family protein n=1 Tax=Phenylobacterium sp. TaxID=1871053 RepID=UPI00391B7C3A